VKAQNMTTQKNPRRVQTGTVRLSYANLFVPRENTLSGKTEYSVMLLVPKTDTETIALLKAASVAAVAAKFPGKPPANLRNPMRDGDAEHAGEEPYVGHYFINVKSGDAPGIVDEYVRPITDPRDLGSGDYARALIDAFCYDTKGNKGVSFGLIALQRIAKGESLGSRVRAEDVFSPVSGNAAEAFADVDPFS
jgi:hypothetical protein